MAKDKGSTEPNDPTSDLRERFLKLSGADKAAMLMLLMGEEHAAQVINHLEPKDVQTLGKKMVEVANLPKDVVNAVLDEFLISTSKMSDLGTGNSEYIQKVFKRALGEDKASAALDKIIPEQSLKGLDMLRWMDAAEIHAAIEAEHPQVIAVVLSVCSTGFTFRLHIFSLLRFFHFSYLHHRPERYTTITTKSIVAHPHMHCMDKLCQSFVRDLV